MFLNVFPFLQWMIVCHVGICSYAPTALFAKLYFAPLTRAIEQIWVNLWSQNICVQHPIKQQVQKPSIRLSIRFCLVSMMTFLKVGFDSKGVRFGALYFMSVS